MSFSISGIDEVDALLGTVAPKMGLNIMRSTVHAVTGQIAKDARNAAPEDEGDLKGAIKHKRERIVRSYLRSTVRVNPVAFYWRFLEYGQGPDGEEHAMFLRAVEKFRGQFTAIFTKEFGKKFEAALRREAKRMGAI